MNVLFNPPFAAGLLNEMLDTDDTRPAKEQFNENYAHGGGWSPFGGDKWTIETNLANGKCRLVYPGDPPFQQVAEARLRDEKIVLFDGELVAIIQSDGTFEVTRMD